MQPQVSQHYPIPRLLISVRNVRTRSEKFARIPIPFLNLPQNDELLISMWVQGLNIRYYQFQKHDGLIVVGKLLDSKRERDD